MADARVVEFSKSPQRSTAQRSDETAQLARPASSSVRRRKSPYYWQRRLVNRGLSLVATLKMGIFHISCLQEMVSPLN